MAGAGSNLHARGAGVCGLVVRVALDGTQRSEEKQGIMVLGNNIAFSK